MACCICETDKFSEGYKTIDGFFLLKCEKCGLIYLNAETVPQSFLEEARENLGKENKKIEYWGFPEVYGKYGFVFKKFFKERLERCLRYHPDIKSLFDIGSGYGFWMDYCRGCGIEVKGIDIVNEAVKYAQEALELDVKVSSLADYRFDKSYDVFTLCDVLEHTVNPNHELQTIRNVMNQDALLYIQVPDVLGMRIPYKHNLGLPHHLWQFNFSTLKKLLAKNGFAILKKYHGIQGVIGFYMQGEVNIMKRLEWFIARISCLGNRLAVLCKRAY